MNTLTINPIKHTQRGVVLVVSLMLLLVMTVIGVTAMQTTSLQERMAGNARDHNLAFQAAESGVRDAENFIRGVAALSIFDGSGGLYGVTDTTSDPLELNTLSGSIKHYSDTGLAGIYTQPLYFVQHKGTIIGSQGSLNIGGYGKFKGTGNVSIFEITARGTGGKDTTQVVLRSNFGRTGL